MEPLKVGEILQATGGELINGSSEVEVADIITDSRMARKGMFFIPLKGERFDGHNYIAAAFEAGATGCVTEESIHCDMKDRCVIKVKNSLQALQSIAAYYRQKFSIPFIGITGSVGKTTTKDMIACVLQQNFEVLKTKGNFNNEIGLPLTIFRLGSQHTIGVTEMGMSGFGEIRRLANIAKPDIAIITNIGMSHIEKLGSQENILKAKLEILEELPEHGVAVLNGDDALLFGLNQKLPFRVLYYGIKNNQCALKAKNISYSSGHDSKFDIEVDGNVYQVSVPVPGEHNIYNALAALAVGYTLNMDMSKMIDGIAQFEPEAMRTDIFKSGDITVINDCYNASPSSMEAGLKVLKQIGGKKRKIAILGDMLEMGEWALEAHKKVGNEVVSNEIDYLITLGRNGKSIATGAVQMGMPEEHIFCYSSNDEIIKFIGSFIKPGDSILVKGSRGMKMETISEFIRGVK